MKTLTEFSGFQLNNALKLPDQQAEAVGTALKLEGDKLKHFMNALEAIKGRPNGLKRVVVLTFSEGEKRPENLTEKEGSFYLAEYFYVPQPNREGRGKFGKRDGKRGPRDRANGDKRDRGRRPDGGGGGSRRPPRGPGGAARPIPNHPSISVAGGVGTPTGGGASAAPGTPIAGEGSDKTRPRRPRRDRPPRRFDKKPVGVPGIPGKGPVIIPRAQVQAAAAVASGGSAPAPAPAESAPTSPTTPAVAGSDEKKAV